jgi:hypothetical protein
MNKMEVNTCSTVQLPVKLTMMCLKGLDFEAKKNCESVCQLWNLIITEDSYLKEKEIYFIDKLMPRVNPRLVACLGGEKQVCALPVINFAGERFSQFCQTPTFEGTERYLTPADLEGHPVIRGQNEAGSRYIVLTLYCRTGDNPEWSPMVLPIFEHTRYLSEQTLGLIEATFAKKMAKCPVTSSFYTIESIESVRSEMFNRQT